jgi:hypothetical protein
MLRLSHESNRFSYPKQKVVNIMAKATTAKKVVILSDASISTAWLNFCSTGKKAEGAIIKNAEVLARAVTGSKLSITEAQELIRASKRESSFMSVSQVEALGVWLAMRKDSDFKALKLAKQLSVASSAYSLLGVTNAKALADTAKLEVIQSEIKKARKVKQDKAKEKARGTASKAGEKKASLPETLAGILAFFVATDMNIYTEKQLDVICEISATIESKYSKVEVTA